MPIRAMIGVLIMLAQGCCSCPDQEAFTKLPLLRKIAVVRESNQHGCTCEGGWLWYINQIANYGDSAVSAMLPLLDDHDNSFPAFDAVSVIRQANRLHYNAHSAVPKLKQLAAQAHSSATRQNAAAAIQEIDGIRWTR
jgi:hypothetical protein